MIIHHCRRSVNIRKRCNMHKSVQNRPAHILRFTVLLSVGNRVNICTAERQITENRGYAVPDTTEPESKGLTVQMPADFFTEHTLGNLRQICENKSALFQTAFQTDSLDIISSDERVEFPWFTVEQDGDADAYCTFISMLCEFAKNQSRINRKPDTSDNPKYTMRCFLIRLGMVGAEFKAARKVILRNLTGNSAFRKVGDTDAVSE